MTPFNSESRHERFEELCACATAGILTPEESESLALHLETCASCKQAFAEYRYIGTEGIPSLAEYFESNLAESVFEEASALDRLMHSTESLNPVVVPTQQRWNYSWVRGVAAAILFIAIGAAGYRIGTHSAPIVSTTSQPALDRANEEKQGLERMLQSESQRILALQRHVTDDQVDIARLRAQVNSNAARAGALADELSAARKDASEQLAALAQDRDANVNKLHDADKLYQNVQDELNALRSQHQQDLLRVASLETRVNSLNADLNDQNKRTATDSQFLALDKDVRDLIGARNLYIADIMDVNETGQSKRPFGRVFYTKTKSLIFYAYDLDQQPGVKRANTFQVWGRTSANDRKPGNLGVLYMDSETNQRWTLRVDNPARLANLDAVFVTVEPHEQADKPTGKPFLYASLRREANHP